MLMLPEGQPLVDSSNNDGVVGSPNNDGVVGSSNIDGVVGSPNNDGVVLSLNIDGVVHSLNDDGVEGPSNYPFPFENLVFEGGGSKGLAYIGCLQYLEELNAMKHIRRVGGSSAGAITAALVALGYTSEEIEGFLSENVQEIVLDHSCGYLSLLPNLICKFGWIPGEKIFKWFGDKIKDKSKTRNPDMTFLDLYKERNHMELCVVVTNINQMRTEYCHPKTTPDMPIRVALRMSMSIPGMFAARKYEIQGQSEFYVDGGVLCNYPKHCFDGWFLSMKESDSFFTRVDSPFNFMDKRNFEGVNEKTLGFLLYEDTEKDLMRAALEERIGSLEPEKPDKQTKLFKCKDKISKKKMDAEVNYKARVEAKEALFKVIKGANEKDPDEIDKDELGKALMDENFSKFKPLLFGKDESVETIFNTLDENHDGKSGAQSYWRKDVTSVKEFLFAVLETLLINMKFVYFSVTDKKRTVGINTGHVGTSDYDLEEEDRQFIVERGKNSTKAFFEDYHKKPRGQNVNGGADPNGTASPS